jgi:hypothetical protein
MITRLIFLTYNTGASFATEECSALFQTATDEHWGADCSKLMKVWSVYNFDRHFQIARTTTYFKYDVLLAFPNEWWVAEKTGNVQDCIEVNKRQIRAMESYIRAAPPPNLEVPLSIITRGAFVGVEAHHQHLQPRRDLTRFFQYAGINSIQQAEEGLRSSAEYAIFRLISKSSADGLTHMFHEHAVVSLIRAVLSFSVAGTVELSWLDELLPVDATTLHCTVISAFNTTTTRVLVAEVFEQQGRHADAIRFAQTDLQDYHNLNVTAKVRAGRVLGRCHAALGEHMLSVSAFDAAIDLARSRKLLLSDALSVQGRAAVGRNGTGESSGVHWNGEVGRQRLAEVMDRMQGPRDALESALSLPR